MNQENDELEILDKSLTGSPDYASFQDLVEKASTIAEDTEARMEENRIEIRDILTNNSAHYEVAETELLEKPADSDINAQTGHLHLNIITGGTQTVLPRSRKKNEVAGMQYVWKSGKDSKYAWDTKHKYEGYKIRAPIQTHQGRYVLDFCYMQLEFPRDIDFGDDYLTLHPEFSEVGQRHDHVYATQARDGDPASRLALRVIGERVDGTPLDLYLSRITESAVEKANAFVDRILEGIDEDELKSRPRRWVHPRRNKASKQQ